MPHYLLSAHTVEDHSAEAHTGGPTSEEDMRQTMQRIGALEEEMATAGVWLFSARLHGPETATVVQESAGRTLMTDGPFAETKEHLAGFYIITAEDLDAALLWAAKVTACVNTPIEVRPFAGFTDRPGTPSAA